MVGRSTDSGAILGRGVLRVPFWGTLEQTGLGTTSRYKRQQNNKFKHFSKIVASGIWGGCVD